LLNITGGADLGLFEVDVAAGLIEKSADPDANIIIGAVIDEKLGDEIVITVIATGFEQAPIIRKQDKMAAASDKQEKQSKSVYTQKISPTLDVTGDELDIPTFLRRNRFK
jgi:cell division protein FtsZ